MMDLRGTLRKRSGGGRESEAADKVRAGFLEA